MNFYLDRLFLFILICLIWVSTGCSWVHSLSLRPHFFGKKAEHILWIQVAGLSEEHLALIKFEKKDMNYQTEFEKFKCLGKIWSYNYFELRPSPDKGFFSQMVGSQDIQNSCEDLKHRPIWRILDKAQFNVAILEAEKTGRYSLSKKWDCPLGKKFFEGISLVKMDPPPKRKAKNTLKWFNYQRTKSFEPGLFYDRSCRKKKCFSGLINNVRALWGMLSRRERPQLLVVRDFSFYRAIKRGNFREARGILDEINKVISFVNKKSSSDDLSILVTTTSSLFLEFPSAGKQWLEFEKEGKGIAFRKSSLVSSVWAFGLGSENFCGFYKESEILKRILWDPRRKLSQKSL